MTLAFELDLDTVKLNQSARYLRQRWSFSSKVIVWRQTHTSDQLLYLDHWTGRKL